MEIPMDEDKTTTDETMNNEEISSDPEVENLLRTAFTRSHEAAFAAPSPRFRERACSAGAAVASVLRLRKETEDNAPFDGRTFDEFLLTTLSPMELDQLCEWYGVNDFSGHTSSGAGMGALARDIGMKLDEVLLRTRIAFLGNQLSMPLEDLVPATVGCRPAFQQPKCVFSPLQWDQFLSLRERDLPAKDIWRLNQLELEIRRGYNLQ
jgi:hypothetical protein